MAVLILSTTALGLLSSEQSRRRVTVCRELVVFCEMLSLDIGFRATPVTQLADRLLRQPQLQHLDFLSLNHIKSRLPVPSCLSREENEELARFLFSLGKSDTKSQLALIASFRDYIEKAEEKYTEKHHRDAKLYVTFGFFTGTVISLMML